MEPTYRSAVKQVRRIPRMELVVLCERFYLPLEQQ